MNRDEYECAISGITAEGAISSDKDGLGTLPPGWTRLTVEHREVNMKWMAIRDLKEAMVENILKQYPEDQREIQRLAISLQVDAQFGALEAATPIYETSKEVVYLAPRDAHPGIRQVIDNLSENLGIESLVYEDAEPDEEADEAPEAPAPTPAPAPAPSARKKKP